MLCGKWEWKYWVQSTPSSYSQGSPQRSLPDPRAPSAEHLKTACLILCLSLYSQGNRGSRGGVMPKVTWWTPSQLSPEPLTWSRDASRAQSSAGEKACTLALGVSGMPLVHNWPDMPLLTQQPQGFRAGIPLTPAHASWWFSQDLGNFFSETTRIKRKKSKLNWTIFLKIFHWYQNILLKEYILNLLHQFVHFFCFLFFQKAII